MSGGECMVGWGVRGWVVVVIEEGGVEGRNGL